LNSGKNLVGQQKNQQNNQSMDNFNNQSQAVQGNFYGTSQSGLLVNANNTGPQVNGIYNSIQQKPSGAKHYRSNTKLEKQSFNSSSI
jgi:hypothetical protein